MDISVALDGSKKRDITFYSGDDMGITLTVYEHDGDASPITPTDIRFTSGDGDYVYDETFTVPEAYIGRTSYRIIGEVDGLTTTLVYGILTTDAGWPWFTSSGTGGRAWGTKAENITIDDDGAYFSGDEVEEALQELGSWVRGVQTVDQGGVNVLSSTYQASSLGILAAFNAASAVAAASGRFVYFPGGTTYDLYGATVIAPIKGDGDGSHIRVSNATADVFTVTTNYCDIEGLKFSSSVARTGGWFVHFSGASLSRCTLRKFKMYGAFGGIRTTAGGSITVDDGMIFDCRAGTGIAISVEYGVDNSVHRMLIDATVQPFAGIRITNSGDTDITDSNIIKQGISLLVQPGVGQAVTSTWANNTYFDQSTRGIYLLADGGSIARSIFDECWFSSNTLAGATLARTGAGTIDGTDFATCHAFANGADGITIGTGASNTAVNFGAYAGNAGAGVGVVANVNDFAVTDARLGNSHGFGGNAYGVFIAAGTSNDYVVANNRMKGNTVANFSDGGTGVSKIVTPNIT